MPAPPDPSRSPPAEPVELAPGVALPAAALRFRFDRSGGPGGQNVNKLNTRATLSVSIEALVSVLDPAALQRLRRLAGRAVAADRLVLSSDSSRSQRANRDQCLAKLRAYVRLALVRPRPRKPTRPTRGAVERRLRQKARDSGVKRTRQVRPGPEP